MENKHKKVIIMISSIVLVCICVFTFCIRNNSRIKDVTHYEGFDDVDVSVIQGVYGGKLEYLKYTDVVDIDFMKYKILYMKISKEKRPNTLKSLKEKLNNQCYVFYSKISYDATPEIICFLRSNDKYDVLRSLGTNGINYDIDTDQLVKRLTSWDNNYGIEIEGADSDWVDIKFINLPTDLKKIAEEIYDFCPDSVDQGVGSIEELENYLKENNEVFLWWD